MLADQVRKVALAAEADLGLERTVAFPALRIGEPCRRFGIDAGALAVIQPDMANRAASAGT